jgi:hypothetical protein
MTQLIKIQGNNPVESPPDTPLTLFSGHHRHKAKPLGDNKIQLRLIKLDFFMEDLYNI